MKKYISPKFIYKLFLENTTAFSIGLLGIFLRFYNYREFLYFIYDQGRDAFKMQEILTGDLTLVGPTSGLPGFFIGPLWYYAGVPGFVLSGGNPYGIALWYIFLACLAIPGFYYISSKLFKEKVWQLTTFALLTFLPGSLWGSVFIWNPLIAIPILTALIICLWNSPKSRWWLGLSFLLIGMLMQSEFAYAVIFAPLFALLIPFIRRKFDLRDYLVAAVAGGVTVLPQLAFEIKNNWIMTQSLIAAVLDKERTVSWIKLFESRPLSLFLSTKEVTLGRIGGSMGIFIAFTLLVFGGLWLIYSKNKEIRHNLYKWQIISIIAITPYVFYMFWRGNYGNFFPYYLTSHFIVLVPLMVLGLKNLQLLFTKFIELRNLHLNKTNANIIQIVFVTILFSFSFIQYQQLMGQPENNAGMNKIHQAVKTALVWRIRDIDLMQADFSTPEGAIVAFAPNYSTQQYDYFLHWLSKKDGLAVPNTVSTPMHRVVYLVIEPDWQIPENRFLKWYQPLTANRILVRRKMEGVVAVETWMDVNLANELGLAEYRTTVKERRHW